MSSFFMSFIVLVFPLLVLFFSIVIHEVAHGSMALMLGDPTAKERGRLTLNPIKHIDPFGTIILPLLLLLITAGQGPIFGWAKPVPVNPYNFKDKRWGSLKVAAVGPAVNFLIAVIFGLAIRFVSLPASLLIPFEIISIYNFLWGLFNLLPIPPLDGSHILFSLLPYTWNKFKRFLNQYGLLLLVMFLFFGISFLFDIAAFLFTLTSGLSPMI